MKSIKWSLYFISTLLLHKTIAQDNPLDSLNNAIGNDLETLTLDKKEFRADATKAVRLHNICFFIYIELEH